MDTHPVLTPHKANPSVSRPLSAGTRGIDVKNGGY